MIFPFVLSQTKSVIFENHLKVSDPDAINAIRQASEARERLSQYLQARKSSKECLEAAEEYLPHLMSIIAILDKHPDKLKSGLFSKKLEFEWMSVLGLHTFPKIKISQPRFEVNYVMLIYGMLVSNTAWELLANCEDTDSYHEVSKEAASLLCKAAGIFDYCAEVEFPKWHNLPSNRPPEVKPAVPAALKRVCLAEAEQLAIQKAVREGKTSSAALAKLCKSVQELFDEADDILKQMQEVDQKELSKPLRTFIKSSASFAKSITFKYLGMDAHSKDECGKCVAYLKESLRLADAALGLPYPPPDFKVPPELVEEVDHFKASLREKAGKFEKENEVVHQQKVPEVADLEETSAMSIMKATEYSLPEATFTDF